MVARSAPPSNPTNRGKRREMPLSCRAASSPRPAWCTGLTVRSAPLISQTWRHQKENVKRGRACARASAPVWTPAARGQCRACLTSVGSNQTEGVIASAATT